MAIGKFQDAERKFPQLTLYPRIGPMPPKVEVSRVARPVQSPSKGSRWRLSAPLFNNQTPCLSIL